MQKPQRKLKGSVALHGRNYGHKALHYIKKSASIIAFYTDEAKEEKKVEIIYLENREEKRMKVSPLSEEGIKSLRL